MAAHPHPERRRRAPAPRRTTPPRHGACRRARRRRWTHHARREERAEGRRIVGPRRCWNSKATGGPPIATAVPNAFETNPALMLDQHVDRHGRGEDRKDDAEQGHTTGRDRQARRAQLVQQEQSRNRARHRADQQMADRGPVDVVVLTRHVGDGGQRRDEDQAEGERLGHDDLRDHPAGGEQVEPEADRALHDRPDEDGPRR